VEVETVLLRVPTHPSYVSVLRTVVRAFAAREELTLDQIEDLQLAVEEAAVQLLRQATGEYLTVDVSAPEEGIEVRLQAEVTPGNPIVDRASFSWTILHTLADRVDLDTRGDAAVIILAKLREKADTDVVTLRVPAAKAQVVVLRTAVQAFAAREEFTLDQVDDLRLAVEEAAVQLLRHVQGEQLVLDMSAGPAGIELSLHAKVATSAPVIDESSLSWLILRELSDDVRIEMQPGHGAIVMFKHRTVVAKGGAR
jgi:serine/threonine-protein kinase RsbW